MNKNNQISLKFQLEESKKKAIIIGQAPPKKQTRFHLEKLGCIIGC